MVFEIIHPNGNARVGKLTTEHGVVETPFFMPVGSKGSVKAMEGTDLEDMGYQAMISNSFILSLVPGIDVIEEAGGIHKFMNFSHTSFTDSGGFQVLSKDFLLKKSEKGVLFKDQNGKKELFTPELCMQNQIRIKSDVAMTLDDVAHYGMDGKDYVDAIRRTHDWAKRSLVEHKKLKDETDSRQLLFGIAQGGTREEYDAYIERVNRFNELHPNWREEHEARRIN